MSDLEEAKELFDLPLCSGCETKKAARVIIQSLQTKLSAAEDNLEQAVFRIKDMLMGDDGQAWDEAEKFLGMLNKQKDLR